MILDATSDPDQYPEEEREKEGYTIERRACPAKPSNKPSYDSSPEDCVAAGRTNKILRVEEWAVTRFGYTFFWEEEEEGRGE
eukprot:13316830-Ditylum_brightwellii.AAC.1